MRSAFIISKPLQYFNAKNIPYKEDEKKDCFLINNFIDAPQFAQYIKPLNIWNRVKFFSSDLVAIVYFIINVRKYNRLYIYADISTIITILLSCIKSKIEIYTYEEGFGSYRYFSYRSNGVFFEKIRDLFKITNWIGGNGLTKGIFVYHPNVLNKLIPESKKKEVYKLSGSFYQSVVNSAESDFFLDEIDYNQLKDKSIFLLIGSWTINPKYREILESYPNYVTILKLHPHFRTSLNTFNFDLVIRTMPSEILIVNLIKICKELIVVHENSTTMIYLPFSTRDKIHEINISDNEDSKRKYEKIKNNLLSDK